jgi:DNA (cytosine-5)-methyltransferase 1
MGMQPFRDYSPSPLSTVDLFCGCGGLSMGLVGAGFDVQAGFDCWDKALLSYNANLPHAAMRADFRTEAAVEAVRAFSPDFIAGSPPCQDFSSAGHRNENNGRAELTVRFAEVVTNVMPAFFLMENVPLVKNSKALAESKEMLLKKGYGLTEVILDASLCGVPQKRKRYFLIGHLGAQEGFLNIFLKENLATEALTVRNALGSLFPHERYFMCARNYKRPSVFSVDKPAPTVRGQNQRMPKTYKWNIRDFGEESADVHVLTTKERLLIQSFPSSYLLAGTEKDREQMIGNAVPPMLAQYVGNCIQQYIQTLN